MAIPMTLRIPVFKRRRSLSKTKTETPGPAFESKKTRTAALVLSKMYLYKRIKSQEHTMQFSVLF